MRPHKNLPRSVEMSSPATQSMSGLFELANELGFDPDFRDAVLATVESHRGPKGASAAFQDAVSAYASHGTIPSHAPDDWRWRAALVFAALPAMVDRHRRLQVPPAITRATARDLERWAMDVQSTRHGQQSLPLGWFLNHIHRNLLEIGRLQFLPITFAYPYRIYSGRTDARRVAVLAEAGLNCSSEGWRPKDTAAFVTTLQENSVETIGHPVHSGSGRIESDLIVLRKSDWNLICSRGDHVLDVHIPSGGSLLVAECLDCFKEAEETFARCFPDRDPKAFTCTSWLLDRELAHCLPAATRIVAFGNLFNPLAAADCNHQQLIERVLDNTSDWQTFEPRTSLQRAVVAHFRRGGTFRTTAGFRLSGAANPSASAK